MELHSYGFRFVFVLSSSAVMHQEFQGGAWWAHGSQKMRFKLQNVGLKIKPEMWEHLAAGNCKTHTVFCGKAARSRSECILGSSPFSRKWSLVLLYIQLRFSECVHYCGRY